LTENESKNKKNSIKTTKFKFGFEKLKKNPWEKNPNKLCMIVILKEEKL